MIFRVILWFNFSRLFSSFRPTSRLFFSQWRGNDSGIKKSPAVFLSFPLLCSRGVLCLIEKKLDKHLPRTHSSSSHILSFRHFSSGCFLNVRCTYRCKFIQINTHSTDRQISRWCKNNRFIEGRRDTKTWQKKAWFRLLKAKVNATLQDYIWKFLFPPKM